MIIYYGINGYEPEQQELKEAVLKLFAQNYGIDYDKVKDLYRDDWLDYDRLIEEFKDELKDYFEDDATKCFASNEEEEAEYEEYRSWYNNTRL